MTTEPCGGSWRGCIIDERLHKNPLFCEGERRKDSVIRSPRQHFLFPERKAGCFLRDKKCVQFIILLFLLFLLSLLLITWNEWCTLSLHPSIFIDRTIEKICHFHGQEKAGDRVASGGGFDAFIFSTSYKKEQPSDFYLLGWHKTTWMICVGTEKSRKKEATFILDITRRTKNKTSVHIKLLMYAYACYIVSSSSEHNRVYVFLAEKQFIIVHE